MSGYDYCFYEIIFKGGYLHAPEQTKLIQDDDFEEQLDNRGEDREAAKHFVVPNSKILEVNKKCGYELLEHLNDYYREIES